MIGADWESQNKINSSWENASSMRWHLSWKCANWETLVFSCCGDQASSTCGLCANTSYLLLHRHDLETTQALVGLLEHNQHRVHGPFCWKRTHSMSQTSQECIILMGIKMSSSELQWPNAIALFSLFLNIGREGNVAVLWHAVTLWAKWESLEKSKSVTLNDDISAFVAEESVCVFLLAPVKKAFGVLSLNIFTLLFLLYSWYSWIKYVQLLSFGCFSTVWKLDEAKNMD